MNTRKELFLKSVAFLSPLSDKQRLAISEVLEELVFNGEQPCRH